MKSLVENLEVTKIFLGDNSKYLFFSWLCDGIDKNKPTYILHGSKIEIVEDEFYQIVTTYKIPPDEIIFIPEPDDDCVELPCGNSTQFIYFEGFPYRKHSIDYEARLISDLYPDNTLFVVLMVNVSNLGSTDITGLDGALQIAEREYLKTEYCNNVIIIETRAELFKVFNIIRNTENYLFYKLMRDLNELQSCIKNAELEYNEKIVFGFWEANCKDINFSNSLYFHNEICSFDSIKPFIGENISIWDIYVEQAEKKLFDKSCNGIIKKIIDFYANLLNRKSLVMWDVEKDKQILLNDLKKRFREYFYSNDNIRIYRKRKLIIKDQTDYLHAIAVNNKIVSHSNFGINAVFIKEMDNFICKICFDVLNCRIRRYYARLEEFISD